MIKKYIVINKESNKIVEEFFFNSTIGYPVNERMENHYGHQWTKYNRLIEVASEL